VKLIVYADESGTHDQTGTQLNSQAATVGGLLAPQEEWTAFSFQWQKVLDDYGAPYFHFREWSAADAVIRRGCEPRSDFQKNPYRSWDAQHLSSFATKLATVAGSGNKLVVGGYVHTRAFHQGKLTGETNIGANPYEFCLDNFFTSVIETIARHRPPWKRLPLSFCFDGSDDAKWKQGVKTVFQRYKAKYHNFENVTFAKSSSTLALQAADMVAYRGRQIAGRWADKLDTLQWPEMDNALFRQMYSYFDQVLKRRK
jgi:hypothetical protein